MPRTKTLAVGVAAVVALAVPRLIRAQSLLDRPDNVSSDWIGSTGTLYFHFVHRFNQGPPPDRKVTNFPTFLVATGFASKALLGFNYATNSALAERYPNEWEFFGRYAPLQQEDGAPLDLGGQADYNLSVKHVDGELSVARRQGPVRLIALGRIIGDTLGGDKSRFGFGGGGTLRFGRFIAVAGDAFTLTKREPGEKVAWSAGLHIALPNTPHTLSLHVSNATTSTLQGFSRGGDTRRYGFEFTVPIHVRRFFSTPEPIAAPPIRVAEAAPVDSAARPTPVPVTPTVADSARRAAANPTVADSTRRVPTQPPVADSTRRVPTQPPVADSARRPTPTPTPTTGARPTTDTAAARPPTQPPGAAPRQQPGAAARPPAQRPAAQQAPKVVNARIKGQAFLPDRIEVTAGSTVRWKNLDAMIHTVTATDKSFDSGIINADGSYGHTFSKPGTYPFYCAAHPFMKATIIVK